MQRVEFCSDKQACRYVRSFMHICKNDETRSANLTELQRFEEVRIPPPPSCVEERVEIRSYSGEYN